MHTWTLDSAHTVIGFKVRHLKVSTVRGAFTDFSGTVTSPDDTFEKAQVHFTAQTKSINTNNEMRDNHLRSADFFEVEKFPTLSFTSTQVEKTGDHFTLTGNLTMRDVTKPVTLTVTFDGIDQDTKGNRVAGFDMTGVINRKDFGLLWNVALETGGVMVSDEVTLDIHVEAIESK
jgi:polyisoprenoid-binding protein YceI